MLRRLILTLGLGMAVVALLCGPAAAQQYPETPPVDVLPDDGAPPDAVGNPPAQVGDVGGVDDVQVAGDVVTRSRSLPVTGGDVVGLAAIGAGAVALGGVLVAQRRRITT